ncbi:hypothetical protein [Streptomyces sp. NPDC059564]|uniref:hypothetical protein n=1 Tax=Streptomyces sp. NPDC059564 TaxID=3346865 RepID=UPI0036C9E487
MNRTTPVRLREMPPPIELDIVEAWRPYRIRITDIGWETRHQLPQPAKPHEPLDPE